jgi:hypothetical protein
MDEKRKSAERAYGPAVTAILRRQPLSDLAPTFQRHEAPRAERPVKRELQDEEAYANEHVR